MCESNICDVLLAASEYLSKLGSNLRIRSEAFREKRVCRSKLRTTQDVQKAADKLLLICSLSKKSLENVELGVHNVLNSLDDALNMDKTAKSSSTHKKFTGKYYTFEFETHVLRIKNKICLQKFTSVKVVASKMSLDELLRYPVYYKCALLKKTRNIHLQQSDDTDFEKKSSHVIEKACESKNIKAKEKSNVIDHCVQQDTTAAPKEIVSEANSSVLASDGDVLANDGLNDVESTKIVNKLSSSEKDVHSLEITESVVSSDTLRLDKEKSHAERPLIKCVDLNKLLDSNVAHTQNNIKAQEHKSEEKLKVESITNKQDTKMKSNRNEDLEDRNKKRLDVLNFVPREFSIKIIRLPATVLAKYLRTEVIPSGKKLSEMQSEYTPVFEDKNGKEDIDEGNLPIVDINAGDVPLQSTEKPVEGSTHDCVQAKKQLLNYSSSSDVEDINKIKNDLLNNTSSDEDLIKRDKTSGVKRKKIISSSSSSDGGPIPYSEDRHKDAGGKRRHGEDKHKRMCKVRH